MPVIANVLSQHAEEAAMLWILRRAAVAAPHYSLADLAKIDGRVEAHLDGLRIAGDEGWKFCEEQLAAKEEGEVFAAGVIAFESAGPELIKTDLAVVEQEPETIDGLVSALGWLSVEQALPHIENLLRNEMPIHQQIGLSAAAIHRWNPGAALARMMASEHAAVRARALEAAGELGDKQVIQDLLISLRDPDESCVFAAAWSGTLLGLPACAAVLLSIAESYSPNSPAAADLALRRMDVASALAFHAKLVADPTRIRPAIRSAGTIGDPSVIPWLISLMDQLPLARLAGESFTTITGVDLAYRDLERKPPEDYNAGPTEDPADENVEMDPDDNLPWPEPSLVQQWWDANRSRFQNGSRYLLGNPITDDWLKIVLRDGRQRQRAAAALEIALRNPGQP
jgi:uncharacterized protein (TIGR02270 family)